MSAQRDLATRLAAVRAPQPPADLSQRIKREIPRDLASAVEGDRIRLRRGVSISVRIAIAVVALLLLIWLSFAVLDVREHEERAHNPPVQKSETRNQKRERMPELDLVYAQAASCDRLTRLRELGT